MTCPEPPPDPATVAAALNAFLDRLAAAVVADLVPLPVADSAVADASDPPPRQPDE